MADHSIDEVAELTGISVRSVRNYLRLYREFLHPGRGPCNSLRFRDEDVETLVKIRARLRQGETRDEIRARLARGQDRDEMTVVRRPPAGEGASERALVPRGVGEALERQTELMEQILTENLALRERISRLERHLTSEVQDPRRRRVRRRGGSLEIRVPYFLLRAGDGARALVGALAALLPSGRPRNRPRS